MTRQLKTTEQLSIIVKDRFVLWKLLWRSDFTAYTTIGELSLYITRQTSWLFTEQLRWYRHSNQLYHPTTTTIVGDWWCRVIVKWLEVRLGGIGAHNVSEEGCCYGATLLLNRSELNLQWLVKTLRFQWANVRRIKLHMVTADIVGMDKVYSL